MILDATAGNRTMWMHKNAENIIYLDIEKELEIKPQIIADNTKTPFKDKTFDTIFYDPPHNWGKVSFYFSFKNREELQKVFPHHKGVPTYYGWDKFKTKDALINHLNKASKEFYRILKDDGLLWLKWNEMAMPLRTILVIFREWEELMRLYVNDPTHTAGQAQTYWILLCKKKNIGEQKQLTSYSFS